MPTRLNGVLIWTKRILRYPELRRAIFIRLLKLGLPDIHDCLCSIICSHSITSYRLKKSKTREKESLENIIGLIETCDWAKHFVVVLYTKFTLNFQIGLLPGRISLGWWVPCRLKASRDWFYPSVKSSWSQRRNHPLFYLFW